MQCDVDGIKAQAKFCTDIILRLYAKVLINADADVSLGVPNHTQMQEDIRYIRRELMELSKMLDPWRKD